MSEKQKQIVLASADLFIFPRAWNLDGFGMTTIEALALGTTVLTTDFGPQREIVVNAKQGFRYRPHDTIDLAKKIKMIFSLDKNLITLINKNGLKKVNKFDEEKANKKVLKIVTESII